MGPSRSVLAVEIGPVATVAAVERGGHRTGVLFGDRITLPTPMLEGDGRDLITAVPATRREAAGPMVAALAEHLRAVASRAGPVDVVVLTTPPGWGPRHQEMVSQAGQQAGLGEVQLVSEAAAVAIGSFPTASDGAVVLVCQLGERASQVSVLRRHSSGWERVATQPIAEATGEQLDNALASMLDLHLPDSEEVLSQLASARQRLLDGEPAAVVVADRPAPVHVSPDALQHAAAPLRQAVAGVVADALDAAGVDAERLAGTVVYGEAAPALSPSPHEWDQVGIVATTPGSGRLATVYGALDSVTGPTRPLGRFLPKDRWWLHISQMAAPIVCAVAGGLLVWQHFDIVERLMPSDVGPLAGDYGQLRAYFDTATFALSGWALALTCIALGRNLAATLLADPGPGRARQAGRIFAFAALVGLAVAMLQGLLAQAIFGGPAELAPPYLTSALAGAAVPAGLAMLIGIVAPWLKGHPLWTDRLRFPLTSVVLAVGGVLAVNVRSSGIASDVLPTAIRAFLGLSGAAMLGVAIAFTLVAHPAARLVLAVIMGTACMIIVGVGTMHSTIVIYLFAVALWWIRRASRILADNLPSEWWRAFVPEGNGNGRQDPA